MKTKILTIIAITLLTIGCNDDVEYDYGDFREIYATYEGNNILTYNAQDDSPTVTLHADVWNEKTVAAGERAFVRYTVINQIGDREYNVHIDGYSKLFCDAVRKGSTDDIAGYSSTPIDMTSIWRSGRYININAWVPHVESGAKIMLIVDEATIDEPIPEVYLVYSVGAKPATFERKCYASFDIYNLWMRETCTAIRIHVDDPTGQSEYVFAK